MPTQETTLPTKAITPLNAEEISVMKGLEDTEDKAYEALKVTLTQAPIMQRLVWSKPFHVFVDASDVAIGSALMQLIDPSWYQPVYYASCKLSRARRDDIQHQ